MNKDSCSPLYSKTSSEFRFHEFSRIFVFSFWTSFLLAKKIMKNSKVYINCRCPIFLFTKTNIWPLKKCRIEFNPDFKLSDEKNECLESIDSSLVMDTGAILQLSIPGCKLTCNKIKSELATCTYTKGKKK